MKEIVNEISPNLMAGSRKWINEEVNTIEKLWHETGDRISEKDAEIKTLLCATRDVLELISSCNGKLSSLDSELICIETNENVQMEEFESIQRQLCVSLNRSCFIAFHF